MNCFRSLRLLSMVVLLMILPIACFAQRGPYFKRGQNNDMEEWKLIYVDHFSFRSTIDENWIPQNEAPDQIMSSRWRENLTTRWGKLVISNRKESRCGKEWTSGSMYCSRVFGYGFYECRMRISKATGVNNSFWMQAGRKPGMHAFEIDFVEAHYPNKIYVTIHDWGAEGVERLSSISYLYEPDVDLSAEYHIYGCNWDEDKISFYFDGELIWETENTFCDHVGPIVLGTAVLGWAGQINDTIDGTDMRVDYVRVWEKKKEKR